MLQDVVRGLKVAKMCQFQWSQLLQTEVLHSPSRVDLQNTPTATLTSMSYVYLLVLMWLIVALLILRTVCRPVLFTCVISSFCSTRPVYMS